MGYHLRPYCGLMSVKNITYLLVFLYVNVKACIASLAMLPLLKKGEKSGVTRPMHIRLLAQLHSWSFIIFASLHHACS
jgi:hypothetical protein